MKYYADNMFLGLKNWPNVHDQYWNFWSLCSYFYKYAIPFNIWFQRWNNVSQTNCCVTFTQLKQVNSTQLSWSKHYWENFRSWKQRARLLIKPQFPTLPLLSFVYIVLLAAKCLLIHSDRSNFSREPKGGRGGGVLSTMGFK